MARVLITRHLPAGGTDPLIEAGHEIIDRDDDAPFTPEQLKAAVSDVDAVVCVLTDKIDAGVIAAGAAPAGRLKVVANVAVGYDNVDLAAAQAAQVAVCNTPGVLDETTADIAFLLILAATRRASEAEIDLRAQRWPGWGINQYLGHDIHGATLGLVGYGRIAQAVARRAAGFSMTVRHHTRSNTNLDGWCADLDEMISECDVVSIHVPLTEQTRGLFDAKRIARMSRSAVLVNTSRGPVVDEDALVDALEAGEIFGAGLDVYANESAVNPRLFNAPHTVLLPHIGSASHTTRQQMARVACAGVVAVLAGEQPDNLVVD